ncbi:MAG TPA: 4Fe-4S dicluster domain-containing protein [Clostridia bacterium]|nr:4Fe-4S dicluster domain-containing protein [Clostridia bacterium]
MAKRYGMVLDLDRCIGCYTCVVACKMQHGTRPGVDYNQVKRIEWGEYPDAKQRFGLTMCMHCEDAPCAKACPVGAIYTTEEGVVLTDYDTCVGCGACAQACPYGQRYIVSDDVTSFEGVVLPFEEEAAKRLDVAESCTFCYGRAKAGEKPICTVHCPAQCRIFGDVNDPKSEISKYIKDHNAVQVKGTSIYYVMPKGMKRSLLPPDHIVTASAATGKNQNTIKKNDSGINAGVLAAGAIGMAALARGKYIYSQKEENQEEDRKGGDK